MEEVKTPEKEIPMETPTPQPENKPEEKEEKNSAMPIIIAVLVTLVLCTAAVIIYLQFFNGKNGVVDDTADNTNTEVVEDKTDEDTTDSDVCSPDGEDCDDDTTTEETSQYDEFNGEVLSSTKIKKDWRVIEYMDGEGTESLIETETYEGLTGLAIINPDDERVFSMAAVTGIGFAGCYDYAEFTDDSPSYRAQMESVASDMGETLNVTDYTSTEYEEFDFLGTTIRRIGKKYFYDTQEGNNYFEAPCVTGIISLEGLMYEDSAGYKMEAYFYGAEDTATSGDLLIVDQILDSLELVE